MNIKLKELEYQTRAVNSVCNVFNNKFFLCPNCEYQNPILNVNDNEVKKELMNNINKANNGIENVLLHKNAIIDSNSLFLDVKMETGTGKTYVYTRVIYELNKKFGIHKFIILVPSLAIKVGTQLFIENSKNYFNKELGYDNYLCLHSQMDGEFTKNKFPISVNNFYSNTLNRDISVLLANDDYFSEKRYGQCCEGSIIENLTYGNNRCPKDVIADTKPFIIIDEPHNFKDENTVMTFILNQINPQCIIRFGATFPERIERIGSGRNRQNNIIVDYKNLVFDLSTKEAFNKGYIKEVSIFNTEEMDSLVKNIKFSDFKKGEKLTVNYNNEIGEPKNQIINVGDTLGFLGEKFSKFKLESVTSKNAYFNGIKVNSFKDSKIIYSLSDFNESYQEGMIMAGLRKHFSIEKSNLNEKHLIKTICLFFISDIDLYRDRGNGRETTLKILFEKCLRNQIAEELKNINRKNKYELLYERFLNATLKNLDKNDINKYKVHGGYFSGDTDKKDDSEYSRILKEKSKTLNLINENGIIDVNENGEIILTKDDGTTTKEVTFNTFRFIFSAWTLKEGWDNPNVFTIIKLRSSKSDNRKIQELGRGLRIPVDVQMNRLDGESFELNYIIDNREKDFGDKIKVEIYGEEIKLNTKISNEILSKIAEKKNVSIDDAFAELIVEHIINRDGNIINVNMLITHYEDCINNKLKKSAIKMNPTNKGLMTKINKENYKKIKDLWELLNNRYYISINKNSFTEAECTQYIMEGINSIKESDYRNLININRTYSTNSNEVINTDYFYVDYEKMKYNDFLISLSEKTKVSILTLHTTFTEYASATGIENKITNDFFNINVRNKLADYINLRKFENLNEKFKYIKLNCDIKKTALTDDNGRVLDEIPANDIGVMGEGFVQSDKYLYDLLRYDSEIEKNNINSNANKEVIVYGKIPRRSIKIPKIDGHTTSPDFMYVIKENNNTQSINLVIETKGYENENGLSGNEIKDKKHQEKFFEQFKNDLAELNINFTYIYQLENDELNKLVDGLLKK